MFNCLADMLTDALELADGKVCVPRFVGLMQLVGVVGGNGEA